MSLTSYRGYTIEAKKYRNFDEFYARIRETGNETEDCASATQAISRAKVIIDNYSEYQKPDEHLERSYEELTNEY
jgi:hypothetical protein